MLKQRAKAFLDRYTPQVRILVESFTVCQHDTLTEMSKEVAGKVHTPRRCTAQIFSRLRGDISFPIFQNKKTKKKQNESSGGANFQPAALVYPMDTNRHNVSDIDGS